MEQTIGKRIAENRKRLGLTQDALAEQLGVTAQAVSKWENDQSCPDITMLPKLAEIFGTSTDDLLGRESQTVHQAEVVTNTEEKEKGGGKWEVTWDAGKWGTLGFACWVLSLGVLLLVNNIYDLGAGFWGLAWPSFLLMVGLFGGKKFSFGKLGFVLLGGYFLIDNLGFLPASLSGDILWPLLVILFGLSLLMDALRKPNKPKFRIVHNGKEVDGESKKTSSFSTDTHSFDCSLAFGEETRYISIPLLQEGDISCSFGSLTVDLSGCEAVSSECEIDASCAFGALTLLVPKRFLLEPDSSTAFGNIEYFGEPDPEPTGVIRLDASTGFGHMEIHYI